MGEAMLINQQGEGDKILHIADHQPLPLSPNSSPTGGEGSNMARLINGALLRV
jgi:hypothetical protein